MIEKKLSIRKLYKGKFPTKDSVRLTAEAVVELAPLVTPVNVVELPIAV